MRYTQWSNARTRAFRKRACSPNCIRPPATPMFNGMRIRECHATLESRLARRCALASRRDRVGDEEKGSGEHSRKRAKRRSSKERYGEAREMEGVSEEERSSKEARGLRASLQRGSPAARGLRGSRRRKSRTASADRVRARQSLSAACKRFACLARLLIFFPVDSRKLPVYSSFLLPRSLSARAAVENDAPSRILVY